ncbi:VanW family protein [Bacillus sp. Marseille-P3661]|uniref:VanW family protein n=1 Tax=Bacillus sp. Marseille-P3661 TaxID=1936234 RepID=UPI000C867660|nr:VanW family protein [Bacillus sp. Marseille-P3661]
MIYTWLTLLFLLYQQFHIPDNITITENGKTVESVNRQEFTIPLTDTFIDVEKYNEFVNNIESKIYKEPTNASLDDNGIITPEQTGYKLNRQAFGDQFYSYFFNNGPATIEIPGLVVFPKVDSELLASIKTKQIGYYITFFNSRNKERSHNIELATQAINNHVVFPGETFSFNSVVGKRTKDKGYLPAPVIVRGELTEGIGGGICQVSSTLFNAVDRAGLSIGERYSHSKRVPYVPEGRDATVSWYGPDFTFHNKHNQPILIRAKAIHGKMIVTVYSSDVIDNAPRKVENAPKKLPKEIKEKQQFPDALFHH